ncbi:MAG: nitroreductase family protein, partial [Eubacteriales bacterium]|nr:nitroreductase family protein [Eubacteriales bacterium]
MDVREAIRGRRSIRKYEAGAVIPKKDIESILEAAMMAPSARNARPWEFVVVLNEEKKNRIMEFSP